MAEARGFSLLERFELKYHIPVAWADRIGAFLAPYCEEDYYSKITPGGFYWITNLYLDSPFILSSAIGWTYEKTFLGLSYSRNFVQGIVLSSVAAAMIMQAIGDNVGRGLGMMGALSVVRFRTSFKDPRDIMFIFAALGAGIGCGVYAWGAAVGGTIAFCCVAFLLSRTGLGTKHFFDGMLRFALPNEGDARAQVEHIMKTSLKTFILITMREVDGGARLDVAYQIRLRATKPAAEILNDLSKIEGISDVQFMMQDATTEM